MRSIASFKTSGRTIIGTIPVITGLITGSCTNNINEKEPPNILFIIVDDLRPELGCFGNSVIKTPNLDRFAENSVTFTNAFCHIGISAPARASLMTGLRPDSTRVWHLEDNFRKNLPDVLTIPQYLHQFGYYTIGIGKIFHNHMPDSISFDEPDLRPDEFKTEEMVYRDAESFYHDENLRQELDSVRNERLKLDPNAYAGGWAYGRSVECSDAPDSVFYDGAQTLLAIESMERLKKEKKPFFLALGLYRPHLPFSAPKKYWDMYNRDSIPLADNNYLPVNSPVFAMNSNHELRGCYDLEFVKHPSVYTLPDDTARMLKHGYYASISYIDACIGLLIDEMEEMGLLENTIVVITGDNGFKLGENGAWCKHTNYIIDTRIPLIVYTPELESRREKSTRLIEHVDIFPTLCQLAGISIPDYLQGTSFVPLLKQPDAEWKSAAFTQFHRKPKETPDGNRYMGYSIITEKYRYTEWKYWDYEQKVAGALVATELYDLSADPQENINISNRPENSILIADLSSRLNMGWRFELPPGTGRLAK